MELRAPQAQNNVASQAQDLPGSEEHPQTYTHIYIDIYIYILIDRQRGRKIIANSKLSYTEKTMDRGISLGHPGHKNLEGKYTKN